MTVRVYRSTDASAPTLNGIAGSMIAILDACLVNGYGTQPAMGWGKPFSGTNLAVYRAAVGTRYFLRVDDASSVNGFNVRGYESVSGTTDSGTNGFPTTSFSPLGTLMNKSSTLDSVARSWMLIASERSFYWFCASQSGNANIDNVSSFSFLARDQFFFGEILSYKDTADNYNCFLFSSLNTSYSDGTNFSNWGTAQQDHYGARTHTGVKVAHGFGTTFVGQVSSQTSVITYTFNSTTTEPPAIFPEPVTGGMMMGSVEVMEQTDVSNNPPYYVTRGRMPGFYGAFTGDFSFKGGYIVNGTGEHAGKQFISVFLGATSSVGIAWIEITDNWYVL